MCGRIALSLPGIDPAGRACSSVSFEGKALAHFLTRQRDSVSLPGHTAHKTPKIPVRVSVWTCFPAARSMRSGCISRNPVFLFFFKVFVVQQSCSAHVGSLFSHLHTPGGVQLFECGYF